MLDPALGRFDHVVAMDSLIHYAQADTVGALGTLARARDALDRLHLRAEQPAARDHDAPVGRLFPREDRAPCHRADRRARACAPRIAADPALAGWQVGRTERVASGFYTSQAMELVKPMKQLRLRVARIWTQGRPGFLPFADAATRGAAAAAPAAPVAVPGLGRHGARCC